MNVDKPDIKPDPSDEAGDDTYSYSNTQEKEEEEEVLVHVTDTGSEKEEVTLENDVQEPVPYAAEDNQNSGNDMSNDTEESSMDPANETNSENELAAEDDRHVDEIGEPVPEEEIVVSEQIAEKNDAQAEPDPVENTPNNFSPAPKRKGRKLQYIVIAAILLFIIGASFALIYQSFNGDLYPSDDKVAVIYVQGTLLTSSIPGGLGYATSEDISENIRDAVNDENVRAIVLRINSPGGSSTAGEEVYSEVKKASESGVPIVVSMGDVAASAAYHISAPADLIVANPSTMTGSIGTIWTFQNLSEYYDSEGVEFYVSKSGEFKDMGAPWRGLSMDEKEYADKVVVEVYSNFVNDVAEGRNMSVGEVKDLADGRIYTGRKAKELGLVDEFGNLYDAIDMAAELGGIEGEPTVVYMNKPTLSSLLFGSEADASVAVDEFLRYYEESPYGNIE